jgi:hypothetical protein
VKRFRVSIDALVLHGFRPEDRYAIAHGFQEELTRLLARPDPSRDPRRLRGAAVMKLPPVSIAGTPKPHSVGVQVARAVGRSLVK